jgi:hypothetical protein
MKQSEAAAFWPLIKAWGEGKTLQRIQTKIAYGQTISVDWCDVKEIDSTLNPSQYRIKPEPREWYLSVDKYDNVMGSRTERNEYFTVKVREVLE